LTVLKLYTHNFVLLSELQVLVEGPFINVGNLYLRMSLVYWYICVCRLVFIFSYNRKIPIPNSIYCHFREGIYSMICLGTQWISAFAIFTI